MKTPSAVSKETLLLPLSFSEDQDIHLLFALHKAAFGLGKIVKGKVLASWFD